MVPPDIEESVLSALNIIFAYELQTVLGQTNDGVTLKTLKQAPLQDDPTSPQVAPYVIYQIDTQRKARRMTHEEQQEYGGPEIGGPLRYMLFCYAECGIPFQTTREGASSAINRLMGYLMETLVKYYDLSGVNTLGSQKSPDMSQIIEGANMYLIDEKLTHIAGGETTWYGHGQLWWHYPVSWYWQGRLNLS